MDKEKMMSAMEFISPELIEAAEGKAACVSGRWKRALLTAACLCLVLAGTVVAFEAAKVDVFKIFTGERQEGVHTVFGGYQYSGAGIAEVPVKAFSEELLADAAACAAESEGEEVDLFGDAPYQLVSYDKEFASLEEAEAYVGFDVFDNSLLDASEAVRPLLDEGGYCNATVGVFDDGENGGMPRNVTLCASYNVEHANSMGIPSTHSVSVIARIFSELYPHDRLENPFGFGYGDPVDSISQESYRTPGGLEATIVEAVTPHYTDYTAYVILDGVMLRIHTFGDKMALCAVLDAFE